MIGCRIGGGVSFLSREGTVGCRSPWYVCVGSAGGGGGGGVGAEWAVVGRGFPVRLF